MEEVLVKIIKPTTKGKKYTAIIKNRKTKKLRKISFGAIDYEQFKDSTTLKLYSSKNTNSTKRRKAYKARHTYAKPKYSAGWFANKYLW